MNDSTTRDKLKARAAEARREAEQIERLETVLDLGFTIEELRSAVMAYDRASGALVPSVARPLAKLSTSGARERKPSGYKQATCRVCGDTFLTLRADALMCPKRECHAKREAFTKAQKKIAEAAVAGALKDGTAQEFLEHVDTSTRAKAARLIVAAKDKGRVLVPGDALRAAVTIRKEETRHATH